MPILTVHLEKITNLADEDHIGKSDPYVKVCIVLCCFVPWAAGRDQEFFSYVIARLQLHLLPLANSADPLIGELAGAVASRKRAPQNSQGLFETFLVGIGPLLPY